MMCVRSRLQHRPGSRWGAYDDLNHWSGGVGGIHEYPTQPAEQHDCDKPRGTELR